MSARRQPYRKHKLAPCRFCGRIPTFGRLEARQLPPATRKFVVFCEDDDHIFEVSGRGRRVVADKWNGAMNVEV